MASHGVPRPSSSRLARTGQARAKELAKIEEYRNLVALVQEKMVEKDYTTATLSQITALLTLNPEYSTIWNYRRLILTHLLHSPNSKPQPLLQTDLKFLLPLHLTHPKAYTLYTHRHWLLQQSLLLLPASSSLPIFISELALCSTLLSRDPRNFHGWGYRRLVSEELVGMMREKGGEVVEAEFDYANRMVEANLSNFSAWHARAAWGIRVLDVRRADASERLRFFENELSLITRALYTDPYDQSLWFYHTYLLLTTCSPKSPPSPSPSRKSITTLTPPQKSHYLAQTLATLRDLLDSGDVEDCKWVFEALVVYGRMIGRVDPGRRDGGVGEEEVMGWLGKLEVLDPLRAGRWKDWKRGVGVLE
ncbi:hypothetical protein FGG08_001089 [Glutinoglossum americanum]|uniref:Geranylgeranyl transferase type-2 subunit alpha n=1 Tax=Glutinoglossum americanum TaxID=1670608 RepID=A0A9P8L5M0_9PEZI|nr:hypothetical protein FGG08_001089 [Glutinoglossum americanum]